MPNVEKNLFTFIVENIEKKEQNHFALSENEKKNVEMFRNSEPKIDSAALGMLQNENFIFWKNSLHTQANKMSKLPTAVVRYSTPILFHGSLGRFSEMIT